MEKKKPNRFYEDDPDSLEFSESPVTDAERKRAEEFWKELAEE